MKKVIKEKITDVTVSIFGEKNYLFSENKNYLLIEIKNINNFSYQENKIYSANLDVNIYMIINKGDFNLALNYSNDLVSLLENQNNIKNLKINNVEFSAYKDEDINLGGRFSLNILLKCED
ncbi:hypothetical protein [Spiroplasma endosymbiont of Poecilobothrus nobilitatus]|uniref:hypothetical protein n=1 Tax=Spiroplasma endosymbiont of Poecilobothrus nobilitatus TaxID=1209220 RepID=UPI00313BFDB7